MQMGRIVLCLIALVSLFVPAVSSRQLPEVSTLQDSGFTQVIIRDFEFRPLGATGGLNDAGIHTVRWENLGPSTHTVTADDGAFDSGPLARGATFTAILRTEGTFAYHCNFYASMRGQIVVRKAQDLDKEGGGDGY